MTTCSEKSPTRSKSFPETLSYSSLSTFLDCEEQWRFRYGLRIVPKAGERSSKMVDGLAFAKGVEIARRALHEQGREESQARALGLGAVLQAYGVEAPEQSPHRGVYAYVDYTERYSLTRDYLQPAQFRAGRSGIEFTFAIPIASCWNPSTSEPILFTGRCDMIASWRGGNFVVDEKTTGSLGTHWAEGWELDAQILGYMWAAAEHDIRVTGAVVRGISPQAETTKFAEAIVYATAAKHAAWLDWFQKTFRRMVHAWEENSWTLDRGFQCKMGGGCPYALICRQTNETLKRRAINEAYKTRG
jgi:hypothetical protein